MFFAYSHKRGGFFVEVGAHDGVSMSNTLFEDLERNVCPTSLIIPTGWGKKR